MITSGAHTDVGKKRDHNEDYFYRSDLDKTVDNSDGYLFIAADGVGGNRGGAEASKAACEQLPKHFFDPEKRGSSLAQRLTDAINYTHHDIRSIAAENPLFAEMSCTIVILAVVDGEGVIAHLGDARIYQMRDSNLKQVTVDHSWVQEQVELGNLTPQQASVHRNRNVVTRTLGGSHMHEPDLRPISIEDGDRFLLCSDGLHGPVPHFDLTSWLQKEGDLNALSQNLVAMANENGGPDNIVALIVQIGEFTAKIVPTERMRAVMRPDAIPGRLNASTQPTAAGRASQPSLAVPRQMSLLRAGSYVTLGAVLFLALWLIFTRDQFLSGFLGVPPPPKTEIAVILTVPVPGLGEAMPDSDQPTIRAITPTSTRAAEATEAPILTEITATPIPTEPELAETGALIETETPTPTEPASVNPTAAVFPTRAATVPKLTLLDIRCDGSHTFEPGEVINFKWRGKESSTLVEGEWMQIALQSADSPAGITRQITDGLANILPTPADNEWIVPRKIGSFGIVGDGNLNWWVEHVVNNKIVDQSDIGCFSIVEKPKPQPAEGGG